MYDAAAEDRASRSMIDGSDLQAIQKLLRPPFSSVPPDGRRITIAKGTEGLGNRLLAFLQCAVYAAATGRQLYVDWRDGMYAPQGENAFPHLFESSLVRSSIDISDYRNIAPEVWTDRLDLSCAQLIDELALDLHYDNWRAIHSRLSADVRDAACRADAVVMWDMYFRFGAVGKYLLDPPVSGSPAERLEFLRRLLRACLKVREDVRGSVSAFVEAAFSRPVIGVHIRQTDNMRHPRKAVALERYPSAIETIRQAEPRAMIFLATDSSAVQEQYQRRFANVVSADKFLGGAAEAALHWSAGEVDRVQLAREAVRDMCLLSACDYLVYSSRSSFGRLAVLFSDTPLGNCTDVEIAS